VTTRYRWVRWPGPWDLRGATMDARELPSEPAALADTMSEYTTFGRVRPDQKRAMVHALQSREHTVAMTGDGVNDVLALKDADIGVAMGSGSPASRAVAQIVLLDNKFATLPFVVGEGRRVIGNIERVSNLFLTKTVYSVLLALLVGLAGLVSHWGHTEPLLYPFQPIPRDHRAWFTIGIPAFVLSLAPNNERARTGFVRRVMTAALPAGAVVGIATFTSYLLAYPGRDGTAAEQMQASTGALITLLIARYGAGGGGPALPVVAGGSGSHFRDVLRVHLSRCDCPPKVHARRVRLLSDCDAVLIGTLAAVLIEASWWVQGRVLGEPRALWRSND